MDIEQTWKIAKDYADKNGYEKIRRACERKNVCYYRLIKESSYGHKTGLPKFLKISTLNGEISYPSSTEEAMWAYGEEKKLHQF